MSKMETITDSNFGNYYGSFKVGTKDGKYFASVENWDGEDWQPVSEAFYFACVKEFGRAPK